MSQNIISTLSLTHLMPAEDNNCKPLDNSCKPSEEIRRTTSQTIPTISEVATIKAGGYEPYRYINSWGIADEVVLGYSHEADLELEVLGYMKDGLAYGILPLEFEEQLLSPIIYAPRYKEGM